MEYFKSEKIGRTYILKLEQGDYIKESIENLVKSEKIENAVIVTGIATLDRSRLHMIATTDYPMEVSVDTKIDRPLEVVSMDGTIIDGGVHVHMVISDRDQAYGGHVLERCRVLYLGEIVIQELLGMEIQRKEVSPGIFHIVNKR